MLNYLSNMPLGAGQILDGVGYYMLCGQCKNADTVKAENLLPIGVAEGRKLKQKIAKDQVITYDDIELPEERLIDKLRAEQGALFSAHARVRFTRFSLCHLCILESNLSHLHDLVTEPGVDCCLRAEVRWA